MLPLPWRRREEQYLARFDALAHPVEPTLVSAVAKVNAMVFNHPLGFYVPALARQLRRLKPDTRVEVRDYRLLDGEPIAATQLYYYVRRPPQVVVSGSVAREAVEELARVLEFARAASRRLLLYSEVKAVNVDEPHHYPTPLQSLYLSGNKEDLVDRWFIPGFRALEALIAAQSQGRQSVTLADWREYEPAEPGRGPRAGTMLMLVKKVGDRVVYALAVNVLKLLAWQG